MEKKGREVNKHSSWILSTDARILLQLALLHWNAYSPRLNTCGPSSAMAWVLTKLRNLSKHTFISIMTMMKLIGRLVYSCNDCNDMTENDCYVQRAYILTINCSWVQSGIWKNVQTHLLKSSEALSTINCIKCFATSEQTKSDLRWVYPKNPTVFLRMYPGVWTLSKMEDNMFVLCSSALRKI